VFFEVSLVLLPVSIRVGAFLGYFFMGFFLSLYGDFTGSFVF
jgi:hypothetical protein